jgi:lysophospholipase L1-like esterase
VSPLRLLAGFLLAGIAAGVVSTPKPASADDRTYACTDRNHIGRLSSPLARMRRLIIAGRAVTIMALGSSSTAGAGASTPKASYPAQLEAYLSTRFPGIRITVLNRGVNGDEAADMLRRFDKVASDDKPDVVLWQLGTNSVLRNHPAAAVDRLLTEGVLRMQRLGLDIVLINPQFAPAVLKTPGAVERMIGLIEAASTSRSVDLFRRFQVMREWHEAEAIPFDGFLSPDQLHMNDWGYACLARLLGAAMAEAVMRPVASIVAPPEQ